MCLIPLCMGVAASEKCQNSSSYSCTYHNCILAPSAHTHSSGCSFKVLFFTICSTFIIMCLGISVWFSYLEHSAHVLDVCFLCQVKGGFQLLLLKRCFFFPSLYDFFLWYPILVILIFLMLLRSSIKLSFFVFLWFSLYLNSRSSSATRAFQITSSNLFLSLSMFESCNVLFSLFSSYVELWVIFLIVLLPLCWDFLHS